MIPTDILNYRVVRHLGTGGMGSVFLAVNTNIDQQVAIKAIKPEVARNTALRARFKQEAELLCSLNHPGIVKFLNYVETPDGVFLIMEYVKGITLEDFIKKKNGLIVEKKAYPLICEILDAFSYAHSKGIVHRDIKPSNIIIQEDGHIKIMDFGIAQIMSESNVTDSKYRMGTPTYMSPEQIYGRNIDARSDIYSIGVLIHNMLTGRAPYDSTTLTAQEIKRKVVTEVVPRMAEYYPYISDSIQLVVDKATQKSPELRYQSCQEMKEAVKKALAPDPIPRPLMYGGAAAALILLLVGGFVWDYFRTKVEYYKDYVEVWGVPQGIGSLSSNEMEHRSGTYRFEYSRYKLRRVSYINSKGNLLDHADSEHKDRIVDMTLSYTEGSGRVDAVKVKNRSGKVLYVKDYDSNFKTCTFKLDDELGTEMTLNAQVNLFQSAFDNSLAGKGKISKYILDYNDDGYLVKVEYAGFGNVRVPDGQGIFGKSFVVDDNGRVIEEHNLGKDGKPKATQFGLGVRKYVYDDEDNLAKVEYLTVDGKPSSDGNNCPIVLYTYDEWGNCVSEKYTDINGQPMIRKDGPFAGVVSEYDNDGFRRKIQYLGMDNKLTYVNGVCGVLCEYDENGYLSRRSFIDSQGRAAFYNDTDEDISYAQQTFVNDSRGNVVDVKILNASNELIEAAVAAHTQFTYDSIGNMLSMYYLDKHSKLYAPVKYGYAGMEMTYNEQSRISRVAFMDASQKCFTLPDKHVGYYTREYDARGNYTRVSYYDAKGNLSVTDEGVAVVCYEYDDNGNESARYFLNAQKKPCVLNSYCSRVEYMYDIQGNCISMQYKNIDGKLMQVNGVACYEWDFDQRGNIVSEKLLGTNGRLASGTLEQRMKYDDRDNVTERSYWTTNGVAALCKDGYHKVLMRYTTSNLCAQMEYYDTKGILKNLNGQNYAVIKREYDERGNMVSATYFTQSGSRGTDDSNVHKYFNQYDKVANKINHQISFGSNGKPVVAKNYAAEGRLEYDKCGNVTKLICYDGYGKKINGNHGWCEKQFIYNNAGLCSSEAYFNMEGKPAVDTSLKYHKVVYEYNDMRLLSCMEFYSANGNRILCTDGYSIVRYKYNNQNQRTEVSYYDVRNKPVNMSNGWHKEVYSYRAGTEYRCDLYDALNRKIATAVKENGKWNVHGVGRQNNSVTSNWRAVWAQMAKECPVKFENDVIFESVVIEVDGIVVSLVFESLVSEQITSDMINAVRELIPNFRKKTDTPSYIDIQIDVYDKYHERVVSI